METKPSPVPLEKITPEVEKLILSEMEKDIAGVEDEATKEFYRELVHDFRESEYLFLRWMGDKFKPAKVLYMASGHDIVPKTVLGEEHVVHMSMENYLSVAGESGETYRDKKYYPGLGGGRKVIGNVTHTPFADSSFQAVLLQDLPIPEIEGLRQQAKRVVESGGVIVLSRSLQTVESEEIQLSQLDKDPELERLEIPQELQERGVSESKFFVYRKK